MSKTEDRLAMMLLGPKKGGNRPDAAEERRERKRGVRSSPQEEALEDARGRAIKVRIPGKTKRGR